ncbi:F0F1 ATP synthase subunit delta [Nocardioides campestrisoli]|uniref:F0F1 ATP synthase subunit delta n=1 Tax=Nocardioides campestrisoli TaxID=2736757 RepID=UPI0015E769E3|nr:F0F1 ATP synthase subunit delta [Nocardioides campestrisoli]
MSLRGASAETYAALSGAVDTALAGGADAARVGDDLFSVAEVLRSEPGLRRIATDVSVDSSAKAGLARQIFGGKLSDDALVVVESAFARRWTQVRDLASALEELGVRAVVTSAGSDSGRLADELFALSELLDANPELRSALADPARSREDKRALLRGLLEGRTLPSTLTLADQALAGTYRTVVAALDSYQQLAASIHGQKVATVRVARPLDERDTERLEAALRRQYDREIHLNIVVDPEVIGGIRVEIGDDIIDGTVSTRLDDARRALAG